LSACHLAECDEAFELLRGKVTVVSSLWHSKYGSAKEFVKWYKEKRPARDVLVCVLLKLQCFPTNWPVWRLGSLDKIGEAIADALPPCAVTGLLTSPRIGDKLVEKLPERGAVVDFAAGIGGWTLGLYYALEIVGRSASYTIYAYDVDADRLAVYREGVEKTTGWRVVPRLADLRRALPSELADVAVGSPPCEDLSSANTSRKPERGLELVERYLDYVDRAKPSLALLEEVASLSETRSAVVKMLRERGWSYEVKCLSDYGAPQLCRRRILGWREG